MKAKLRIYKNYLVNLICPAFVFGSVTGILTSVIVTLFKLCAKYAIGFSEQAYSYLRAHLYLLPIMLVLAMGVSIFLAWVFKKEPNLRGGGIPTSIATLRGMSTVKWLRTLLGEFFLPLVSFTFGVPLGTEGPSVLIGTAVGKGSISIFAKKHTAWNKYAMTGGASAGFSVATGSPVSGIMFAIEEVHGRISPMILMVATISVAFSRITSELLAKIPFLDVDIDLFGHLPQIKSLDMTDLWIPAVVSVIIGIFAVLFLYYYRAIYTFFKKTMSKTPHFVRIFIVFALTIAAGIVSFDYISTGHDIIEQVLASPNFAIYALVIILLVRSTLTLGANSSGVNGGIFIPIMALGAVLASVVAKAFVALGLDPSYYTVIIVIGITACISSMMKTPLTAIVFAIEALACYDNILFVIVASILSFVITEIFRAKSINDTVIENRELEIKGNSEPQRVETTVIIKDGSFAIGKQIRDIFWPYTLKVLSVKHAENRDNDETDKYAENVLRKGDTLHIRYSFTDHNEIKEELYAIVGNQTE